MTAAPRRRSAIPTTTASIDPPTMPRLTAALGLVNRRTIHDIAIAMPPPTASSPGSSPNLWLSARKARGGPGLRRTRQNVFTFGYTPRSSPCAGFLVVAKCAEEGADNAVMEDLMLLRAVREVAALAKPDEPEAVTQRAFDAAREHSATHAGLPAARRITERFGWPWSLVLTVAHEPEHRQAYELGAKSRGPTSLKWLTEEHVVAVLIIAAGRLSQDTVSKTEYRAEREEMLRTDRARWLNGGNLLLPTTGQIVGKVGSWDEALRKAGLRLPHERTPKPREKRAPSFVDLMERFHDHYGVQPTQQALREFARGNGIPYPDHHHVNHVKFSVGRDEWLAQRRANGLLAPKVERSRPGGSSRDSRPAPRPDYSRDVGAARPGERRFGEHRRTKWSREDCIASVTRYLEYTAGSRSTFHGYTSWAATQENAPVVNTLEMHGGWEALRREAQKRMRA